MRVYGYVVMPEHVHLLLSEPRLQTLADALKSLKQGVSRRLIGDAEHFWQKRYYDFNIRNSAQFVEKLRYIHRNPVKRGLCQRAEDWEWSSFRHYATGCEGRIDRDCVRMDSTQTRTSSGETAGSRGTAPLKPKAGLSGPPAKPIGSASFNFRRIQHRRCFQLAERGPEICSRK